MAGGGAIIGGGGRDGNVANVVDGRLQVSAIGGGGGGGLVTQGTIPWVIQEPLSVDDNGGSLTVDGTVAVSNFPASQTVDDGGGSLTVDGTVTVTGTVAVTQSTSPWVIDDPDLKNEGDVAADPGRPSLAVRDDVLSLPVGVIDGDFTFLRVDDGGALWTRERNQTMILSGSTNGQPIQITGTTTGTAVLVHNPGAGNTDQVWLYITSTSNANQFITLEFGGTGVGNEIDMIIGAHDCVLVVAGATISGNNPINVYGQVANLINVFGYARRVA
jgi:hypothetical protein